MINEIWASVHYSPRLQKLLSNPVPSHWSWRRGGGVSAKKHFVIINVSESVSKAFLESFRASNGGLIHRDHHRPSFICLSKTAWNRSTGVGLGAWHSQTTHNGRGFVRLTLAQKELSHGWVLAVWQALGIVGQGRFSFSSSDTISSNNQDHFYQKYLFSKF